MRAPFGGQGLSKWMDGWMDVILFSKEERGGEHGPFEMKRVCDQQERNAGHGQKAQHAKASGFFTCRSPL